MPEQLRSLVDEFVPDGAVVAIGGMGLTRKPMALVAALAAAGRRDLTIVTLAGGLDVDILIAAGCVSRVRAALVSLDMFGLAPAFRAAAELGTVEVVEETEHSVVQGLRAAAEGLPFMPGPQIPGSSLLKARPDVAEVSCPYTGDRYPAWPGIRPDVTLLHAGRADHHGNLALEVQLGIDYLCASASSRTLVSAERVEEVDWSVAGADVPSTHVDRVVEIPSGAWPGSCEPGYDIDVDAVTSYLDEADTAAAGRALIGSSPYA